MAYGKNPENLSNIGTYGQASLRQQVGAASRRGRPGGGGGKGRRPYWAGNLEVSEDPSRPDRIRLLRGDHVQEVLVEAPDGSNVLLKDSYPYLMAREHYHGGKKKGALCSAGAHYMSKENKQPCNGCTFFWSEQDAVADAKARGVRYSRAMSMSDKYVFSAFDYAYYFDVPQTDKNGQFRINGRTNQPYTDWVKAANPQDPTFAGYPWKEGNTLPWMFGRQYLEVLESYSTVVGNHCASCNNQHCVTSVGWYCSNPACRALVIDPRTGLTDEQKTSLSGLHHCGHCQQNTYLQEFVQCAHCPSGKRASLFDVDLYIYLMRSSDNKTQLMIMGASAPGPIMLQTGDASQIAPLDLEKKFEPSSLEEQLELWGPPPAQYNMYHQQAPQMPQPVTGMPVPPPQPAPPAVGYHPQPQQAPQQYVNPNDVSAQLAALAGRPVSP